LIRAIASSSARNRDALDRVSAHEPSPLIKIIAPATLLFGGRGNGERPAGAPLDEAAGTQQILYSLDRGAAMRTWQLQEARSRFSELVSAALAGSPQRVTRHGKAAVIVVSEADWEEVTRKVPSFGQLLAQCPLEPEHLAQRRPARALRGEADE
jgi:antitoxin Phd